MYIGNLSVELRKLKTWKERGDGQEHLQGQKEVGSGGRERRQPSTRRQGNEKNGMSVLWPFFPGTEGAKGTCSQRQGWGLKQTLRRAEI